MGSLRRSHLGADSLRAVVATVVVAFAMHVVVALRSNFIDLRTNRPQSLPWWSAWLLPAPIVAYVAVVSAIGAAAFVVFRDLRRGGA